MTNEEWVSLSDSEKGHLVSIWILAADKNGTIPDSPQAIRRMAMLDTKPNLNKFIELGFLVTTCQPTGNHMVTNPPEVDAPEESRVEESNTMSGKPDPVAEVIKYLNSKNGYKFQPKGANRRLIAARLKDYSVEEVMSVIDVKFSEWHGDPKMEKYIRPSTLFNDEKFSSYVGCAGETAGSDLTRGIYGD